MTKIQNHLISGSLKQLYVCVVCVIAAFRDEISLLWSEGLVVWVLEVLFVTLGQSFALSAPLLKATLNQANCSD